MVLTKVLPAPCKPGLFLRSVIKHASSSGVLTSVLYGILVLAVRSQLLCGTQVSKEGRVQDVATGGVEVAAMAEEEEGTGDPMLTLALLIPTQVSSVRRVCILCCHAAESCWTLG